MPNGDLKKTVGVLALQGGFEKHVEMLEDLSMQIRLVKRGHDLKSCDALVIPGGESTTMLSLLKEENFQKHLIEFATLKPVFGTCAGLIVLAFLGLLKIEIERNAYGRQSDSFETELDFASQKVAAIFIRAPKILKISKEVKVLASYQQTPVLIQQNHLVGATFHPELTSNPLIHKYFLNLF